MTAADGHLRAAIRKLDGQPKAPHWPLDGSSTVAIQVEPFTCVFLHMLPKAIIVSLDFLKARHVKAFCLFLRGEGKALSDVFKRTLVDRAIEAEPLRVL